MYLFISDYSLFYSSSHIFFESSPKPGPARQFDYLLIYKADIAVILWLKNQGYFMKYCYENFFFALLHALRFFLFHEPMDMMIISLNYMNMKSLDGHLIWFYYPCAHLIQTDVLNFNFSSTFNTIIPGTLVDKLCNFGTPSPLTCAWIKDFLTKQQQFVKEGSHFSFKFRSPHHSRSLVYNQNSSGCYTETTWSTSCWWAFIIPPLRACSPAVSQYGMLASPWQTRKLYSRS